MKNKSKKMIFKYNCKLKDHFKKLKLKQKKRSSRVYIPILY